MDKVALLISENLLPFLDGRREDAFEFDEQIAKLQPAFAAQNMQLDTLVWENAHDAAADYAAMMPLMVWDYADGKRQSFLDQMRALEARTKLLNPADMLAWNSDKIYLEELAKKGAPIIPTLFVDSVSTPIIHNAFAQLGCDHIVIKPRIGAGAWRQVALKIGEPIPAPNELPPQAAMIQPFQKNIQTEGEYSLLYFDGAFSHALIKRAKPGDYRIQSLYGGTEEALTPAPQQLSIASHILGLMDDMPLYARVDLLRADDGNFQLIELELIEPYLYLPQAKGEAGENEGAKRLAAAVQKRIGSS